MIGPMVPNPNPRRWNGSVLAINGRLHIQVKTPDGKWRQRSTGLVAVKENWEKAEVLLAEVRAGLLAGRPEIESMAVVRRRALRSFHGSSAIRLTLKRRLALAGRTNCEACGWIPPAPATWRCLNVHHVIARAKGGNDEPSNLVVLCPNCHAMAHAVSRGGVITTREALIAALNVLTGQPTQRALTDVG